MAIVTAKLRRSLFVAIFKVLVSLGTAFCQDSSPATFSSLMANLGHHHHPISTSNPEAQRFFDQGLTLVFAFNYEEALRSFRRAAEFDPQSAMPQWGIALALGPNINRPADPSRDRIASIALQRGLELGRAAPENERAYIQALAKRYSNDPTTNRKGLARDYATAMRQLSQRFPDDLDAATLYAESLMDLHPWKLWSLDGLPLEDTEEIIATLESVLRRDPSHIGANHYYIHAIEASREPGRALASARRLGTAAPAAGHLVHMPSHIYVRIGDYSSAALSNVAAVEADRSYLSGVAGWGGSYDVMYYCHDLSFLTAIYNTMGRFVDAERAADDLVAHVQSMSSMMPELEFYVPTKLFVLLRFSRWEKVLKLPAPQPGFAMATAYWHFGRGVASAARRQIAQANSEREALEKIRGEMGENVVFGGYFNRARRFLDLAADVLDARIATAEGDRERAIQHWVEAVDVEDTLNFSEPPDWYYPVRESLGALLLIAGRPKEAEQIFRADLDRNPRNPRSLFGLWKSLLSQKRSHEAKRVRVEVLAACKNADIQFRLEDL